MKSLRYVMMPAILFGAILFTTGCFWVAAGAGGYAFAKGRLIQVEDVSLDASHAATLTAMDELKFRVRRKPIDALTGKVEATTADNKTVDIKLSKISDTTTEISIRVGTGMLGDEKNREALIMDAIKKNF